MNIIWKTCQIIASKSAAEGILSKSNIWKYEFTNKYVKRPSDSYPDHVGGGPSYSIVEWNFLGLATCIHVVKTKLTHPDNNVFAMMGIWRNIVIGNGYHCSTVDIGIWSYATRRFIHGQSPRSLIKHPLQYIQVIKLCSFFVCTITSTKSTYKRILSGIIILPYISFPNYDFLIAYQVFVRIVVDIDGSYA